MSQHIETRRRLRDVSLVSDFESLLALCTLSEEDKDFRYIGDMLGYSERTIKARHKRALKKLSDAL